MFILKRYNRIFHSLGIQSNIIQHLRNNNIIHPTKIQEKAIPLLLSGKDAIIGAETGSGKTLTYLLPLINRLDQYMIMSNNVQYPIGLILVPSKDLVIQIGNILYSYLKSIEKYSSISISILSSDQYNYVNKKSSIIISTPRAILKDKNITSLLNMSMVIVDEADMLLNGDYSNDTKQIIKILKKKALPLLNDNHLTNDNNYLMKQKKEKKKIDDKNKCQFIFCAATIPDYGKISVSNWLKLAFPSAARICTEGMHHVIPTLNESFVSLDEDTNGPLGTPEKTVETKRQELLLKILSDEETNETCTLVFANSVGSAVAAYNFLLKTYKDTHLGLFHGGLSVLKRNEIINSLMEKKIKIVVSTDIASRGLDIKSIGHVIQYEFAKDVVSYLHRIGRTARAGKKGRVTNIITKENALLVEKIKSNISSGFGRKRSLRKKYKKKIRDEKLKVVNMTKDSMKSL